MRWVEKREDRFSGRGLQREEEKELAINLRGEVREG